MAPMKRPAGASIGGAAKKTKGIKVAILATGGYPEDVLTMLAGSLDSIMSTCKEERHRHQQTAADMVSAVLKAALASAEAGVAAAQARLDELKAQKGDRDTTAEAAAATQTSKKETTIAARDAEKRAVEGLKAAKKELAAANEARTTGDTELVEAEAKKTRLEVFLAGPFEEMKAGSLDDARTKEGCSEVLKIGKEYSFDDSLLTSLPSVIQKAPDARGGFDSLCLAQVQELLQQATSGPRGRRGAGGGRQAGRAGGQEGGGRGGRGAESGEGGGQGLRPRAEGGVRRPGRRPRRAPEAPRRRRGALHGAPGVVQRAPARAGAGGGRGAGR